MRRRLPMDNVTPMKRGQQAEKEVSRRRGLKLHPASGAGRTKGDMSDERQVVELKICDTAESHTVKLSVLKSTLRQAERDGKDAVYIIQFLNEGITLEGRIYRS